jgi:hypothetical protein
MTLRGYGVLLAAIMAGLGSVLFASQYLLSVSAFMFATLGLSIVWMSTHRSTINVQRQTNPEFIYEDSDVLVTLSITGSTTDCSIRDYFDNGKRTTRFFLPRVNKETRTSAQYKFHVDRRGVYNIGPIVVRASDSLGLIAREYSIPNESQLRVYPRISDLALPHIPLRSSEQSRHMDRNASTNSDDLLGLKEYVMGDDIRLIHWKTSSRTRTMFVRHRERQATLPLVIILDCEERSYDNQEEFDSAARLVASMSYAAHTTDVPCKLFCNDKGEFVATHSLIMDRLAVTEPSEFIQAPADSNRLLAEFEHNYLFVTGSHGELFSSAILTLRIVPPGEVSTETFNMIPLRAGQECADFSTRIKTWNAHASLQSLS